MQMALRAARDYIIKAEKAVRHGNFGNSEKRDTNPASRKLPTTPETTR